MDASTIDLIYYLVFGAIAGGIAGFIMRGSGMGLIGNIIVGVLGAFVGNWIFDRFNINLGIENNLVSALIEAVAGASVLLLISGIIFGRKRR